jgi:hypothetical protein
VGSGGKGDRPLRAQLVVAFVVCVILFAVPLYLVRRPSGNEKAVPETSASAAPGKAPQSPLLVDAGMPPVPAVERVRLSAAQRVKCGSSPTSARVEGGLCDNLPYFERALASAIQATADCAPKQKEGGTINFVLSADFTNKKVHVFPGQSGSWRGPQARRATQCVLRALPKPDWATIPHQYRFYWLSISATYPSAAALSTPGGQPTFE